MSNQPWKTMSGGGLGGVLGAVLGVLLGAAIGQVLATPENHLRSNPDPMAQGFADIGDFLGACFGFIGLLVGAGVGGISGAIGGAVLGAGWAARKRREAGMISLDSGVPEELVVQESTLTELDRLQVRMAELKKRQSPPRRTSQG